MDVEQVAGVSVALAATATGALALVREWTARNGLRQAIRQDLEIIQMLPEGSASRANLQAHVDQSVDRLIERDVELRRDPSGIGLAAIILVLAVWIGTRAADDGPGYLWVAAVFLGMLGAVGLPRSVVLTHRDDRGRPLK